MPDRSMAIYHLQAKVIQRSKGRSVVAAAAYRAAEALHDTELGRTQNFLAKAGVVHSEILLPEGAPRRWLDRETLWNEVTAVEGRHDAVLAREIELALPRELSQAEAIRLAQDFVREQFVARGMVADLNVHWGQAGDGTAQPHAHVLLSMRRIDPQGGARQEEKDAGRADRGRDPDGGAGRAHDLAGDFGVDAGAGGRPDPGHPRRAAADRGPAAGHPDQAGDHGTQARRTDKVAGRFARLMAAARLRLGLQRHAVSLSEQAGFGLKERAWNDKALLRLWRERWAEMANERLAELGHDVRIDHRSHAARDLDLEPQNKIGPAGARRAQRGEDAERANEHRAIARRNGERLLAEPALALQALTHQQSTFTRQDLARLVNRQTDGAAQFAAVMAKVEASPELVRVGKDGRGRERFSTREMVRVEQQLIATAIELNRRTTHRVNDKRRVGVVNGARKQLSEEQVLAYLHLTRSRDLAVVVGIAGGGKSTMLGTARQVWEGQGYRVRGAALSGIAAEGLESSAGIESRTIASWEYAWNQDRETLTPKDVLVVDEAGMVGSRQLGRLVDRVHQAGAKLVLVGDAEQLQAIEAGAAFRAIADRVGVMAITEPRRQQVDWQREATKELATARTAMALDRYEAAGMVHRHATREAARAGVIAAWQATRQQSPRQSQIILAHERVDVRALNAAARGVRREAGELGPDQVLQTEAGPLAFAEGDRIYFLRNERGLGVKNGTLGTLERIDGGALTVRLDPAGPVPGLDGAGRGVSFDLAAYADIGHGYAATVHKNQGATVDQAHVLATPGMDRHLAYVAMSRHRQAAQLHWSEEDFGTSDRLRERLGRERTKDTTLDYAEADPDPVASYAEWRGLDPLVPESEIVVRPAPAAEPVKPALAPPAFPPRQGIAAAALAALARHDAAQAASARRELDRPPSIPVPASPSAAPPPVRQQPAQWPWEHLSDDIDLPPLWPAEPYRPVTSEEVERRVAAYLADRPVPEPDPLPSLLARIYRNPEAARGRLDALLRTTAKEEDALAVLGRTGPAMLGKLQGSVGLFASSDDKQERNRAEQAAHDLSDAVLWPRRRHAELATHFRDTLEAQRRRHAVTVPGLSAKALAAIETLKQAGADPRLIERSKRANGFDATEATRAARVAPIWAAIQADILLCLELEPFRRAAAERLKDKLDAVGNRNGFNVAGLVDILNQVDRLADRHAAMEAARAAERQAEERRRNAEIAAAEARQQAAEKAELERKLRELQSRPRPRPSPGPSMG
jgi:Ti-type conjugative transfer relaxase TraA